MCERPVPAEDEKLFPTVGHALLDDLERKLKTAFRVRRAMHDLLGLHNLLGLSLPRVRGLFP